MRCNPVFVYMIMLLLSFADTTSFVDAFQPLSLLQSRFHSLPGSRLGVAEASFISSFNIDYDAFEEDEEDADADWFRDHDRITYHRQSRAGEKVQLIPQPERYSTKDWLHNLRTLPTSRLLQRIKQVLAVNFLWSCIVFGLYYASPIKPRWSGSRAHALLGSALGLLLVFRTNTAYNRFWEGRKIWMEVVTLTRAMGRWVMMFSDCMSTVRVTKMLHLLCAFPICLQEHVQGFRQPGKLEKLLSVDSMDYIDKVTNRPYFITNLLSRELIKIEITEKFTPRERLYMQKLIDDLTKSIAACERIVQTPVPLTYARHTSRFLTLFCLTAPLALVSELGFYIIPFVPLTAWSLYGIQEIGMIIEEPFQRALKLEIFSSTIRRDIADLLHMSRLNRRPLKIKSSSLGYEVPYYRTDTRAVNDELLTQSQIDAAREAAMAAEEDAEAALPEEEMTRVVVSQQATASETEDKQTADGLQTQQFEASHQIEVQVQTQQSLDKFDLSDSTDTITDQDVKE